MLSVGAAPDGRPQFTARVSGYPVYLDTDSLTELAKGAEARRKRFVAAIRSGRSTLLFSFANALELSGPLGGSLNAIREFLDSLGRYWIPLEMNPWLIGDRERQPGRNPACLSEDFLEAFFRQRAHDLSQDARRVLDLDADTFFRLSALADWAQEQREEVRTGLRGVDRALIEELTRLREACKANKAALERQYPAIRFDQTQPATFVLTHLMRGLANNRGDHLKEHDAMDFCHVVVGFSYAAFATVDRQWKRRLGYVPWIRTLARIYYRPELRRLVHDLERAIAQSRR